MDEKPQYSGTMTAQQFSEAAKRANATALKLARARRVLVDGETVREVADSAGVQTDVIYRALRQVSAVHKAKLGYWPRMSPMGE